MSSPGDNQIIDLILDRNNAEKGFSLLVGKYQKQIYWHVRRLVLLHEDANDLVQEIFIKIWKNLKEFRRDSKLYTWIYRIATNEALSFLQKKNRSLLFTSDTYEKRVINNLKDDNYFTGDEIQLRFQKALLSLPEKQRLVFNMKYYDEMKYDEIAEITGTSVGALKASYHFAVKKIEDSIRDD